MAIPPNPESINIWAKIQQLCLALHTLLYVEHNVAAAHRYLPRLESLLKELPANDTSIVGAEGHAIHYELCGKVSQAIASRLQEVDLMERLYSDIRKNNYDEMTKRSLLAGRDEVALSIRKAIITSLRRKLKE